MGPPEVEAFLSHLATQRGVSASTQNQALCSLLFLYKQVLGVDIGWMDGVTRAKRPERVPVVLTRQEVALVLGQMQGRDWLMASLMYGTGLRLMECVQLRVQDIDFGYRQITVHNGKGAKDRFLPLPEALIPGVQEQVRASVSVPRLGSLGGPDHRAGEAPPYRPLRGPEGDAVRRAAGGHHQAGDSAHLAALLCHPPPGGGL